MGSQIAGTGEDGGGEVLVLAAGRGGSGRLTAKGLWAVRFWGYCGGCSRGYLKEASCSMGAERAEHDMN